jgi:hypothetical protein
MRSLSITARGLPVSQGRILRLVSEIRGPIITRVLSELFDRSLQVSGTLITKRQLNTNMKKLRLVNILNFPVVSIGCFPSTDTKPFKM